MCWLTNKTWINKFMHILNWLGRTGNAAISFYKLDSVYKAINTKTNINRYILKKPWPLAKLTSVNHSHAGLATIRDSKRQLFTVTLMIMLICCKVKLVAGVGKIFPSDLREQIKHLQNMQREHLQRLHWEKNTAAKSAKHLLLKLKMGQKLPVEV